MNTQGQPSRQRECFAWVTAAGLTAAIAVLGNGCTPSTELPQSASEAAQSGNGSSAPADAKESATPVAAPVAQPRTGPALYAQHCAACHGEKGDGKGLAAAVLYPKPRDFRAGKFRLVSTTNAVPSMDDLRASLIRGMPGSSMPPWSHLGNEEITLLAEEVMRLRRTGLREDTINRLKEEEEEIDEEAVDEIVNNLTTPSEPSEVPKFGEPDQVAVARGKEVYIKQSCHSCHGNEGRGDGVQVMVDAEGLPTKPRDFVRGIFKGKYDPESLYRRIHLGMPGTPMPSSGGNLKPEQIVDMVHWIRSLSNEETRAAQSLKRETLVAKRVATMPGNADAEAWSTIPETVIRTMPLWWRDDAYPDLRVQAVHDGKTVALLLRWLDAVPDLHSARSESFKDAAAVAIYRGPAEPFLGMGNKLAAVDLWMWDAYHQAGPQAFEKQYPDSVVDIYPFHEKQVETAEFSRPGARLSNQPPISLPAVAAGNQIALSKESRGGSSLGAAGPGSTTFHPPKNQYVVAHGAYRDGVWTVLMTRPLSNPDGGIALEPGSTVSIAFGLWDGAKRDRNGQKLVSIWQDLKVE